MAPGLIGLPPPEDELKNSMADFALQTILSNIFYVIIIDFDLYTIECYSSFCSFFSDADLPRLKACHSLLGKFGQCSPAPNHSGSALEGVHSEFKVGYQCKWVLYKPIAVSI
jgi:hypothetical protein